MPCGKAAPATVAGDASAMRTGGSLAKTAATPDTVVAEAIGCGVARMAVAALVDTLPDIVLQPKT